MTGTRYLRARDDVACCGVSHLTGPVPEQKAKPHPKPEKSNLLPALSRTPASAAMVAVAFRGSNIVACARLSGARQ
jgi:hypothetical protein